jgi:hypothetical protein
MKQQHLNILILIVLFPLVSLAQKDITTVGFQIKPLFSSSFFGTGPQSLSDSSFNYTLKPGSGYAAGMIIRKGFTPSLSLEFGLNYVVRNIALTANDGNQEVGNRLRIVGYEVPITQLIFIRLSQQIYMNAGAGFCLNIFPSDVYKRDTSLYVYGGRSHIFTPSLLANIGVEYRTPKSGYFYLGASLNRPFSEIYGISLSYMKNGLPLNSVLGKMNGSYVSVDLKYFFHEDPEKKKARKAKQKGEPVAK